MGPEQAPPQRGHPTSQGPPRGVPEPRLAGWQPPWSLRAAYCTASHRPPAPVAAVTAVHHGAERWRHASWLHEPHPQAMHPWQPPTPAWRQCCPQHQQQQRQLLVLWTAYWTVEQPCPAPLPLGVQPPAQSRCAADGEMVRKAAVQTEPLRQRLAAVWRRSCRGQQRQPRGSGGRGRAQAPRPAHLPASAHQAAWQWHYAGFSWRPRVLQHVMCLQLHPQLKLWQRYQLQLQQAQCGAQGEAQAAVHCARSWCAYPQAKAVAAEKPANAWCAVPRVKAAEPPGNGLQLMLQEARPQMPEGASDWRQLRLSALAPSVRQQKSPPAPPPAFGCSKFAALLVSSFALLPPCLPFVQDWKRWQVFLQVCAQQQQQPACALRPQRP